MCIICQLWQQELLTTREAKKATWEVVNTNEVDLAHLQELYRKLEEEEEEEATTQSHKIKR